MYVRCVLQGLCVIYFTDVLGVCVVQDAVPEFLVEISFAASIPIPSVVAAAEQAGAAILQVYKSEVGCCWVFGGEDPAVVALMQAQLSPPLTPSSLHPTGLQVGRAAEIRQQPPYTSGLSGQPGHLRRVDGERKD